MSWSLRAVGYPLSVLVRLTDDASRHTLQEPEQQIRKQALVTITTALSNYPGDHPVEVNASGSQSTAADGVTFVNQLQLEIKPLWGFLPRLGTEGPKDGS